MAGQSHQGASLSTGGNQSPYGRIGISAPWSSILWDYGEEFRHGNRGVRPGVFPLAASTQHCFSFTEGFPGKCELWSSSPALLEVDKSLWWGPHLSELLDLPCHSICVLLIIILTGNTAHLLRSGYLEKQKHRCIPPRKSQEECPGKSEVINLPETSASARQRYKTSGEENMVICNPQ